MRVDLFYQSAQCRLVTDGEGVRVQLTAGNRKTAQFYAGLRYDNEEYAAMQLSADIPLMNNTVPVNADLTVRLGTRMMGRCELTFHQRSTTSPKVAYTFRRNNIDIYVNGERDYNIRYSHHQADLIPVNVNIRNFNLLLGLHWDYLHYSNTLASSPQVHVKLNNEQFVAAQLQVQQRIGSNHYVLLRLAAGQQAERVRKLFDRRTLLGVHLAYYYNTMLGPLGGALGYSNRTKELYLFLNLGYEF